MARQPDSIYLTEHEADAADNVDTFDDEREGMVADGVVGQPPSPFMAKLKRYLIGGIVVAVIVLVLIVVVGGGGGGGGDTSSKASQQQTDVVPEPTPIRPTVPAPAPAPAPVVPDDYYGDSDAPSGMPSCFGEDCGEYLFCNLEYFLKAQ